MKRIPTLLLTLALGQMSATTAKAGLITDPLSFEAPILDQGLTTDPLGQGGPKPVQLPSANVPAARQFLSRVIVDARAVRLSDLMLNPEFFAAAHAAGPEADALRGQIDWLMMTGLILGLDGDDGLDDLFGGGGDDEVSAESDGTILGGPGSDTLAPFVPSASRSILGGPGSNTLNHGFVFGTTSYVK